MYTDNANKTVRLPQWRSYTLMAALGVGFVALIGRAFYLQGIKREFLQEQGDARYSRTLVLPANRGMIVDRHGEPLAISTPMQSVWASPAEMDVPLSRQQIDILARMLGMRADEVGKKLADKKRTFVYLKRQIQPEVADQVMALKLPGIFKQEEYRRYYPAGEVMAHVVGATGIDNVGQEGIELTKNGVLAGKAGSRHVIKDRRGYIVEDVTSIVKPQDGASLTLALDRKIQYLAYRELKAAVEKHRAKAGSIVVLDAKSGEVLALANQPSYNPNYRGPVDRAMLERKRNRALTDMFEPGSTLKPFAAAGALEAGTFRPESLVATGNGTMPIGPALIRDTHPHGTITVEQVIQVSSNVGASKLALSLEPEYYWKLFTNVGFGQLPHSGFPGESPGRVRPWKTWKPIEQATMSYGHGITVSLIQLARSYMIFTNDGEIKPVSFFKQSAPQPGHKVISTESSVAVRKMLQMVVSPEGTAQRAQVVGYHVGGKTGTAHKQEHGGYAANKYIGSFVGFAPATNPRLIIAVMIDEPSAGQYYGGTVAAPVFASVMTGALRILGVPNDAPVANIVLPDAAEPHVHEEVM